MLHDELLRILVCPETRAPLSIAGPAVLERVNRAIAARSLKNRAGQTLDKPLDGGLLRADRAVLYPIFDDIPMMLVDEAVVLDKLELGSA